MPDIAGGAAQPVQTSSQAPSGGPAIPIAVVTTGAVLAGPYQPIVEVTDNRARIGGPAMPVVVGTGSGVAIAGPPLPVYIVSGSITLIVVTVNLFAFYRRDEPVMASGAARATNLTHYRRGKPLKGLV